MDTKVLLQHGSLSVEMIQNLFQSLESSQARAKKCLTIQDQGRARALLFEAMADIQIAGDGISNVASAYVQLA